jgi:chromosome segregation ATPase
MDKEVLDILKSMQSDMKSMQSDMKSMQSDITAIKSTVSEHSQILRALEHKADVITAEQENLKHEVAEIKGEVKAIRKDLSQVEMVTASNWADIAKLKAVK